MLQQQRAVRFQSFFFQVFLCSWFLFRWYQNQSDWRQIQLFSIFAVFEKVSHTFVYHIDMVGSDSSYIIVFGFFFALNQ